MSRFSSHLVSSSASSSASSAGVPSSRPALRGLGLGLPIAGLLFGCAPKAVRGGPGTDRPNLDQAAMGTGLDRSDLSDLMKINLDALLASGIYAEWKKGPAQPIVAIWPFRNETTEHLGDQLSTLLSDVETQLINGGVVAVVSRERQAELMAEAGLQQGAEFDATKAAQIGRQLGAKYFVTGKVQAVDERQKRERRVQYTLFMQVLEIETGLVRFQHKSERTKALVR